MQTVERDALQDRVTMTSTMQLKLKIAAEAADTYMKIQLPHQTIGDAVVGALQGWSRNVKLETGQPQMHSDISAL